MIIAILIVLGLCLGSFVNAFVWRLHEQSQLARKKNKTDQQLAYQKDLSISKGRSMCPRCKHELAVVDLVPLLSWVILAGKCRYCKQPIAWQYPLVELLTALLFVASYLLWPETWQAPGAFDFAVWLVLLTGFMALALYDIKWFLLPDKVVLPLTLLAAVKIIVDVTVFGGGLTQLANVLGGAAVIAGTFYLLFAVSKGAWIGGGDVKIAAMLGLLAGDALKALLIIFLASLLGTLITLPSLLSGKASRTTHIPFGPFLLMATVIVVLYGDRLVTVYGVLFSLN
jgi:prepilin signal peptidase PulO-like enzyme (type II secretory pathway)